MTIGFYSELYHGGKEELAYYTIKNNYLSLFPCLKDISQFNRRRNALSLVTEMVRKQIADWLSIDEETDRLIDSIPVYFCQYVRAKRCKIGRFDHWMEEMGREKFFLFVVGKRNEKFFGLRVHCTMTRRGIIDELVLAPASFHDLTVAPCLVEKFINLFLHRQ